MDKRIRNPHTMPGRRTAVAALLAGCSALLLGCAPTPTPSLNIAGVLPEADSVPGWKPAGETLTFTRETLFNYIDGASEYYFTYTFEEVAANRYMNAAGMELNAELWQLAEPQDAYGLFSGRTGSAAVSVGQTAEASLESGIRLVFWQNRYYVNLTAVDTVADDDLRLFAEYISQGLPAGGGKPAILGRLPAEGLIPESIKFFHLELAVQDRLWLGGENRLGLGPDTDAVIARYTIGGAECQLVLVEYPDSARAEAGRQALLDDPGDLMGSNTNGALLGAVFGRGGGSAIEILLAKALGQPTTDIP